MIVADSTVVELVTYQAACPSCSTDASWHAVANQSRDLSRTDVTYRVDCPACAIPETEQRSFSGQARAWVTPVSQRGWLGRSA